MGFFDEITSLFTEDEIDKSFHLECFGRNAIVLSGYKKITTLTDSEVTFALKNNAVVTINGAKLYIKKLEESEVVVAGMILNISFSERG